MIAIRRVYAVSRDKRGLETGGPRPAFGAALLAFAISLGLSACTVNDPPNIVSVGPGLPAKSRVTVVEPETAANDVSVQRLSSALVEALATRGFDVVPTGDYDIEMSLTRRVPNIGLAVDEEKDGEKTIRMISEERLRDRFWRCRPQRMRVIIAAISRADGSLVHRSEGELDRCDALDDMIEDMVAEMAPS